LNRAPSHTNPDEAQAIEAAPVLKHSDPIFGLGIIIFCMVLITYGIVWALGITRDSEIQKLDAQISTIDGQIKTDPALSATLTQYMALDNVSKQISGLVNSRILFMNSWNDIKASVPKDVQFNSMSSGTDGVYLITGYAKSISSVASFSQALTAHPEFAAVTPLSISKVDGKNVIQFSLRFKVAKGGKAAS